MSKMKNINRQIINYSDITIMKLNSQFVETPKNPQHINYGNVTTMKI